jgi:hypothetical protein
MRLKTSNVIMGPWNMNRGMECGYGKV